MISGNAEIVMGCSLMGVISASVDKCCVLCDEGLPAVLKSYSLDFCLLEQVNVINSKIFVSIHNSFVTLDQFCTPN